MQPPPTFRMKIHTLRATLFLYFLSLSFFTPLSTVAQKIITVAGSIPQVEGKAALEVQFGVNGLLVDFNNNLLVAEGYFSSIRKITPTGIVTTLAGNGSIGFSGDGGPAIQAQFYGPYGMTMDAAGNLFVADISNHRIRKITANGIISTIAGTGTPGYSGDGGLATQAQLFNPYSVALDASGNLYVTDGGNHRIRKITPTGNISTIAGTGTQGFSGDGGQASQAQIFGPMYIVVDAANNIFFSDGGNHRVRKIAANGTISTVAGTGTQGYSGDSGPATQAQLYNPAGIIFDATGNLFIAEAGNHRVRKVDATGVISTFAGKGTPGFSGDGGLATQAELNNPGGIALDANGNLYVAERGNKRIRKIAPNGTISSFAGNGILGYGGDGGQATQALIYSPKGLAMDASGNMYVADDINQRIRKIAANGIITTIAGTGITGFSGDGGPATQAQIRTPIGVAVDGSGNVYFTDFNNFRVRKIASNGTITTVAGNGTLGFSGDGGQATQAKIGLPSAVAVDGNGNLYIADILTSRIRKVTPAGIISTIAGNGNKGSSGDGGQALLAQMTTPNSIAVDAAGNIYVADIDIHRVRKIATNGIITTIAGNGTSGFSGDGGPATQAQLSSPWYVTLDPAGNMYIADANNQRIRKVTPTGIISTITGTGTPGFSGDDGPARQADMNGPYGIALDAGGNIYFADQFNRRIRKVFFCNAFPAAPTASAATFCAGTTATPLTATPLQGNSLLWYGTNATGGFGIPTAPTPSTAAAGTTTYYVTQANASGCESNRTPITVTINPQPAPPVSGGATYCAGATASPLTASALQGNTLLWYGTNATGGTGTQNAPTPSTNTAGTTTYYVSQVNANSCASNRTPITVTIHPVPAAPTAASVAYCVGAAADALSANAANGNSLRWYTTATGGSASPTAPTPSTSAAGVTTYYVSQVNPNGCESNRTTVTATINALPAAPVASAVSVCLGTTATPLNATASAGNTLRWYTTAAGGSASTSAPTPSTASAGSTTYYVSQVDPNVCESNRTPITVTVNPQPAPPVAAGATYCAGATATPLTAVALQGNNLFWYGTNATGGSATQNAPTPSTSTAGTFTYYVSQVNANSCESNRTPIVVTINALPPKPSITKDANNNLVSSAASGNQWFVDGSALANYNTASIRPPQSGYYTVKATVNSCESPLSDKYYYLITALIDLPDGQYIKVFPNPVVNNQPLTIDWKIQNTKTLKVEVVDIHGRVISTQSLTQSRGEISLPANRGNYLLKFFTNKGQQQTIKIIKQ